MSVLVKICGLASEEAMDAALDHGADMVGLVFYPKSPRHLALNAAARLAQRVRGRARKVLLTVDADDTLLATAIALLSPDILQLHGHETPERVAFVRERYKIPVMKAIAIGEPSDLLDIARFEPVSDFLLFDAKPAPEARLPGGNGKSFDWSLLSAIEIQKPWLLAGGLNAETIADALACTAPQGVDVSSGVESAPGVKDEEKIAAFIARARAAAQKARSNRPELA
jgi:phosphoribosylanthranilate isomerase